jgi:uncharacterized damage-inducible protein DinB
MGAQRNIEMLTRYTQWANQRLYQALQAVPEAGQKAPCPGRPQGMAGVLGHVYVVDLIWKAHLLGQAHGFTSRSAPAYIPCAELAGLQAQEDAWYAGYAQSLSGQDLQESVDFRFVDGGAGRLTRGDMLLHVVNHKTYHRGYVADMLYGLGLKPPTMDLPVFLRDVAQPAG